MRGSPKRDVAPELDFDWEQGIFLALRGGFRKLRRKPAESVNPNRVLLEDEAVSLKTLAGVLSGVGLRIRPASGVGGLRGREVLLPRSIDLSSDPDLNRDVYVVRTAIAAALSGNPAPIGDGQRVGDSLAPHLLLEWLKHCAGLVEGLCSELPMFRERYEAVVEAELASRPAPESLSGRAEWEERAKQAALRGAQPWNEPTLSRRLKKSAKKKDTSSDLLVWGRPLRIVSELEGGEAADDTPGAVDGSESDGDACDELRVLLLNEDDAKEMPSHVFEKVETLENWDGGVKRMDGADDLDDHLEALDEVDLRDLVRGGEQAQAMLRADIALDIDIPDVQRIAPDETGIHYDEWDGRKRRYREAWTTVYPTQVGRGAPAWAEEALGRNRRLIEDLTARLIYHRQELRPRNRQMDGEEVDLDAVVDEMAAVAAGHGGNPRLYVRQAKQRRDVATLVLLDISLSTDSWIQDRRVLDVAREAVLVLGEVTDALNDRLRIMAFASHTRNRVRTFDVLDWNEPWRTGRDRLGALEPQGYTRIGPAIRHATADLRAEDARERLMLIVSDGKPTDYDKYEGKYGVSDVRQAVREAEREGIHVHALAVEAIARDYLPAMVGPGAWHLMPNPSSLSELLTTIYGRLTG